MKRSLAQALRLNQLSDRPTGDRLVSEIAIPVGGWLKAIRQALGRTLKAVGAQIGMSPQSIHQLERSEARGSISLKQLELVAGAMGCRVVYALVPIDGTLADLAHSAKTRAQRAVQHSMSLEGQAVDDPKRLP